MKRVTSQLQQTYLAQSILLDHATWGRRPLRECVLDTITLPPALTMLLRTMVELEGTAQRLSPEFSLAEVIQPFCDTMVRKRFLVRHILSRLQHAYGDWERLAASLPRDLNEVLRRVRDGSFSVSTWNTVTSTHWKCAKLAVARQLPSIDVSMVLRIENVRSDSGTTFMLSGRITSPEVQDLKARVAEETNSVALDLQQVRLVDLDAVRFLAAAERRGVELRNLPRYVREWIFIETPRLGDLE